MGEISTLDKEGQAIVDLARFIWETNEDAVRIYGLTQLPRRNFSDLEPEIAKAMIAIARAVRERLLDPTKLGAAIGSVYGENVDAIAHPVETLIEKIRSL